MTENPNPEKGMESWINRAAGPELIYKRLRPQARAPTLGSAEAVGLDVYSPEEHTIGSWDRELIPLGLSFEIPGGYYLRIASRSGLAVQSYLDVLAGTVDADYKGEVKVLLGNSGPQSYQVRTGDKIAQLILARNYKPNLVEALDSEVPIVVKAGDRGTQGFGSTGI